MSNVLATLLGGVGFGLAIAAPPGPMNAIIAEESVIRGWLSGFTAGLGAMSADAIFFVGTLLGVLEVVRAVPELKAAMVGVGGVLMLYFAAGAARDARDAMAGEEGLTGETSDGDAHVADGGTHATGFKKAFVLALTNPYQVVFWLTVGVAMLQPGQLDVLAVLPVLGDSLAGMVVVDTGSTLLVVGFFGGILAWIVGFPASLVTVGRRVDSFAAAVAAGSAAVLALFGVAFLGDAIGSVL